MNIYEATVPENAGKLRLGAYAAQAFPLLPPHVLRDAFRRRDVKMNGVRTDENTAVLPGAKIQLFTAFELSLPVVYEDENVLVINKPAGISVDDDGRGGQTVLSLLTGRAQNAYLPRLAHRLDNPTCGLLLLSKDDESESLLRDAFENRHVTKKYQCLVRGEMRPAAAVKEAFLIKDAAHSLVRVITHETPGARPIATQYETLSFDGVTSRLLVTLLTGRTHQIRAHMAFLSHPLLGDDKYGDRNYNKRFKSGLCLCSCFLNVQPEGKLRYLADKIFSVEPPF